MKIIKYFTYLLGIVLVSVVGLLLLVNLVDIDRYKGRIEHQISQALGREFVIEGDSELKLLLHPRVVLRDFRLANAPWGSGANMLSVGKVEVQLALIPLLGGEIEIENLLLIEPDILLEIDKDGQKNWEFESLGPAPEPQDKKAESRGGLIVTLHKLSMDRARFVLRDRVSEKTTDLVVDRFTIHRSENEQLKWQLAANLNKIPLNIEGTTSFLSELLRNQPYTSQFSAELGGIEVTLSETAQQPLDVNGLDLKIGFKAKNLQTVSKLANIELPEFGPIELEARVSHETEDYQIDLQGAAEEIEFALNGKLASSLDGKGLAVEFWAKSPDTQPIAKLAGTELPQIGPIEVKGTVSEAGGLYQLDLSSSADEIRIELDGQVAQSLDPKSMNAEIRVQAPDLQDFAVLVGSELPSLAPVMVKGKLADDGAVYQVSLSGEAGKIKFDADGRIAESLDGSGIDMNLAMQAPDLKMLGELAAADLPAVGPIDIKARLNDIKGGHKISNLRAQIGSSDLSGDAELAHQEKPPRILVQLNSKRLDLTPFETPEQPKEEPVEVQASEEQVQVSDKKVFSQEPIPVDRLKGLDVDISYKAKRIQSTSRELTNLELLLKAKEDRLDITLPQARMAKGAIKADAALDATGASPRVRFNLDAKQIELGQLKRFKGSISGGQTDLSVNLSGAGKSVREIMAGLNGKIIVDVGEGELSNESIELIGADLIIQLLQAINPFAQGSDTAPLECIAVRFDIEDGIANTHKGIALATDSMFIVGDGMIDLKTERVDIHIRTTGRKGVDIGVGDLAKVIGVGGTLASPSPVLDAKGAAVAGATVSAAVATGGLSLLAQKTLAKVIKDTSPCQTALSGTKAEDLKQPTPAIP
ncbi:MAG: AsmA family protein [Pseudomonadota bacterium]